MGVSSGSDAGKSGTDLYRLLMKRRSARAFSDQEIPEPWIDELLDAAANSPSGGNMQPFSIIVVREAERRKELAHLVGDQPWVRNAPLSMIFCLDFYRIKKWAEMCQTEFKGESAVNHFLIGYADVMIAAQTVAILAESYGLGSVYIGTIQHEMDKVREFFKIPEFVLPMMLLCVGYPKSIPQHIPKLTRNAIVHKEEYRRSEDDEIRQSFDEKYGAMDEVVEEYLERAFVEVLEYDKQDRSNHSEQVKQEMKRLDIKNNAQFLFKVRYPTHVMVQMNQSLLQSFKNAGFEMFTVSRGKEQEGITPEGLEGKTKPERLLLFPEGALGSEKKGLA
jgi:nitroreductase